MSDLYKENALKSVESMRRHARDTGSPEVQITLLTQRIESLNKNHFSRFKKDFAGRRGLLRLVTERRKQLAYLKRVDVERYTTLLAQLEIRK